MKLSCDLSYDRIKRYSKQHVTYSVTVTNMSYTHTKWDGGESINRRKRKEKRCEIYKEAARIPQGKQKISSRSPCAVVIRFWTLVKDGASCPISTGFLWWPHHAVKVSRTDGHRRRFKGHCRFRAERKEAREVISSHLRKRRD